jgi:crotonobetainyl-CoA:carnitine CoA-transferase CaiB-like acyl-CoA transferase
VSVAPGQLRVAEFCEGISGPLCGRHLALLGADVRRQASTEGDRSRTWGRQAPGALHDLLASGKSRGDDINATDADVILVDEERFDPTWSELDDAPCLIVMFEQECLEDGALARSDSAAQALLGLVDYIGDRVSGPARSGADIGAVCAGFYGVHAVLAWLLSPQRVGVQLVRVSPLRSVAALKTVIWAARTSPDRWSGSHVVARDRRIDTGYRVADGWITIDFPHDAHDAWCELCRELGLDHLIESAGDDWWETVGWGDDVDEARPQFEAALTQLDREAAAALVRRCGGSSVPFNTPREVLAHPQTAALEADPGALPWRVLRGKTDRVLLAPRVGASREAPLTGVRVVDFGVGGVGPFAGSMLATLGADVVKIEAPNEFIHAVRPTADGLSTTYSALNVGKRSLQLNLKDAEAAAEARALARHADVVLENFRPGAMARLGFGYADLAAANPRLVYVSASGFGSVGPLASLQCTDPHIQAFGGWALANAGTDRSPRRSRFYAMLDLVTSTVIVEALLAALVGRRVEGSGAHVEVSMLEAVIALHVSRWAGLKDATDDWMCERLYAPDGLFATADGFIGLSVETDREWAALVDAVGRPDALSRPNWRTNAGRLADEEALEAALAPIFARRSSQGWLLTLASTGVAVARVARDDDAVLRRDLWELDYLRPLLREELAPLHGGGPPWRYDPPLPTLPAPLPGSDNRRPAAFAEAMT